MMAATAISTATVTVTARPPAPLPLQITGCSSGLGRALACRLHAQPPAPPGGPPPYRVYATARSAASLQSLEADGLRVLQLDVTDQVLGGKQVCSRHSALLTTQCALPL